MQLLTLGVGAQSVIRRRCEFERKSNSLSKVLSLDKTRMLYLRHNNSMPRVRISTTVDEALINQARWLRAGSTDAALVDEALRALLAANRGAEIDSAYAIYDDQPINQPDEWGDLGSWRKAAGTS